MLINLCPVQVGIERSTLASHTNMRLVPRDAAKSYPPCRGRAFGVQQIKFQSCHLLCGIDKPLRLCESQPDHLKTGMSLLPCRLPTRAGSW